jgi:hypothetical protein
MANRTWNQPGDVLKSVRVLRPIISVGGAGAVTLKKRQYNSVGSIGNAPSVTLVNAPTSGVGEAFGDGKGVRSVARTGAGAWTITLSDSYIRLEGVLVAQILNATGLVTSGFAVGVVSASTNVATNNGVGNGGVIAVVLNNGSGVATDPASGDTIVLKLLLSDATEP